MSILARSGSLASLACLALSYATLPALADADPFLGTWVVNPAKSKGPPGTVPDNMTLVVSDLGSGMYKSVSDTAMAGIKVRTEVTFAPDGKDYASVTTPATPGAPTIVEAIERVNATTYKVSMKVNGQVVATILEEVSADGKTLTATTSGIGPFAGVSNVTVLDKK